MDSTHGHDRGHQEGAGSASVSEAQRRIDEAFHRDKLGLPLSAAQLRIVQFLSNGFGCHSCPPPETP